MGNLTGKKVLMIVGSKDFRDEEYFQPKVVLQAAGVEVVTVAKTNEEEATGIKGGKAKIDKLLNQVQAKDYDALVFVGGQGSKTYFRDKEAWDLARDFDKSDKVIGAIGIAPVILANAGLLKGKKATVISSEEKKLIAKGAKVTGKSIEVDGKIVTAIGPEAALAFGQKLVNILS